MRPAGAGTAGSWARAPRGALRPTPAPRAAPARQHLPASGRRGRAAAQAPQGVDRAPGGGAGSGPTAVQDLASQLERLRRENAALRAELLALRGQAHPSAAAAAAGPGAAPAAGPAAAAAGAGVAAAGAAGPGGVGGGEAAAAALVEAAGAEAFTAQLRAGVAWPQPGAGAFWDAPPRAAPMPADIGPGRAAPPPRRDGSPLSVVHFTAEMAPIAKVGGLGDVVTGLARVCLSRGHSVAVLLPFYECLPKDQIEGLRHERDLPVPKGYFWDGAMRVGSMQTSVWSGRVAGVPVYLLRPADSEGSPLFRGGRIYGGGYSEAEAYLYFCRAGLEFLRQSRQQPDILHLHEWQTCAAAMLYWEVYHSAGLSRPRLVMTIHNMDNTGEVRQDEFAFTGVPGENFAVIDRALDERTIGHNPERLNLMKGGIVYSNAVTTVSPSYANEILSGGAAGWLRSTLLRPEVRGKLKGILNGIDTDEWNPSTDARLAANYNARFPQGKAVCKEFLQKGLGLAPDASKPLVAVITRLVPQKGIHLIRAALFRTLELGGQFVLLGSGHSDGEFRALAGGQFKGHPDVSLNLFYSEALAHQIYAAADVMLVPSMFEPCGLTQLIGLRYGAVPLVRRTGGLGDTVRDVAAAPPGEGNGYVFDGTDDGSLFGALDRALGAFRADPAAWAELARNNMNEELSWARPAAEYVGIYAALAGVPA